MSFLEEKALLAQALLVALAPTPAPDRLGQAIRAELLVTSLQDPLRPQTLGQLLRTLEHLSAEDVDRQLLVVVREYAAREPDLLLSELARRAR